MKKSKLVKYEGKWTTKKELAKNFGLSKSLVAYRLKNGIDLSSPKTRKGGAPQIHEVDGKKMTTRQIADSVGVSLSAIRKRASRGKNLTDAASTIGGAIKKYNVDGEELTYKEIAEKANLKQRTVRDYLTAGIPAKDIISGSYKVSKLVSEINKLPLQTRLEILALIKTTNIE